MLTPETITAAGKSLLTETIQRMSVRSERAEIEFFESAGSIHFQITAHPEDSRVMVGSGGVHIDALTSLARLLFFGAYRSVQCMTVLSMENAEPIETKDFEPDEEWPKDELTEFALNITKACFSHAQCSVECKLQDPWSHLMEINIDRAHEYPLGRFAKAMSPIMMHIGILNGQKLYVQVNPKTNADNTTRTALARG
jgi:hypothetical protein